MHQKQPGEHIPHNGLWELYLTYRYSVDEGKLLKTKI